VASVGRREMHTGFSWASDRKRPLGSPRSRWGITLKWIFKKWDEGVEWTDLNQHRVMWPALMNTVMNLRVPQTVGNFLTISGRVSFSRRNLLHGVS
jgi:phenylpropionate dioxygenase-like ring-hydroxylating dioxygenase large terminal subunit